VEREEQGGGGVVLLLLGCAAGESAECEWGWGEVEVHVHWNERWLRRDRGEGVDRGGRVTSCWSGRGGSDCEGGWGCLRITPSGLGY
jgi:hypothetical protein